MAMSFDPFGDAAHLNRNFLDFSLAVIMVSTSVNCLV
jgi:hypothetical protein